MIGTTISHYEILEKLGEGGMGVVYKARDKKLDRLVALKFLPPRLSASEQDRARFVHEAKAAAALNHPNVCSIIDIQEHDGQMYIVMEFVDGQTLSALKGSIGFKQAVDIGVQIAEGLAAAHEKGIIHRDIKPDNIMKRKDGIVVIMDFGLAKLRATGSKITKLTRAGSTLGTLGYMSPEQVQGEDSDHRSDIFSFGVLLYELFTGELPFKAVHETALMYEIVNAEPAPMSSVKPDVDPELDRIVLECLQKEPDERYNSVKDIAKDLRRFKRETGKQRLSRSMPVLAGVAVSRQGNVPSGRGRLFRGFPGREWAGWVLAALLLAAGIFLFAMRGTRSDSLGLIRSSLVTPDSVYVNTFGELSGPCVLSPDGRFIAFAGVTPDRMTRLYVRALDDMESRAIPGTEGAHEPFWSPDGRSVGFFRGASMQRVDLAGGLPTTLAPVINPKGGTWNADGVIVYAPDYQSGLYRVTADGKGKPERITLPDSTGHEGSHRWPFFLPDGKHFLYLVRTVSETGAAEGDAVCVGSLDGALKKILVPSSFNPSYAGGFLLFARNSTLFAQRFDVGALSLGGEPVKIQEGVLSDLSNNIAVYSASVKGVLVYQSGTGKSGAPLVIMDRDGKVLRELGDQVEQNEARFSRDGKRIAVYIHDTRTRRSNIWIYDLPTGGCRRLTTGTRGDFGPIWSEDGSRIYYSSRRDSGGCICVQAVTHSAGTEFLFMPSLLVQSNDCSRDGKFLLLTTFAPSSGEGDLWLVPTSGEERKPVPFAQTQFDEVDGRISPDGRWVAYVSDESGEYEVYVRSLVNPQADPWKVSTGGGERPCWGPGSAEVMYQSPATRELVSASLRFSGTGCEVVSVKSLFVYPPFSQSYDVAPDGKTFAFTRTLQMTKTSPFTLVVNWEDALKNR